MKLEKFKLAKSIHEAIIKNTSVSTLFYKKNTYKHITIFRIAQHTFQGLIFNKIWDSVKPLLKVQRTFYILSILNYDDQSLD